MVKEDVKKIGETLLLFYVLFMTISSIIAILSFRFMEESAKGLGMTVGMAFSLLVIVRLWKTEFDKNLLLSKSSKKMNGKALILALLFLFGMQFLFSILSLALEKVLNSAGFSIESQLQSAQGMNQPLIQLAYTLLLAPIGEELLFRGVIFQNLKRYGCWFAIVASSLLFGIYHGNFLQGMFAFVIGLLLAYITEEYSIRWSVFIHIFNNINTIGRNYGFAFFHLDFLVDLYDKICILAFIVSILYFCKKWNLFLNYVRQEKTQRGAWKTLFQNGFILAFILLNLITAIGT